MGKLIVIEGACDGIGKSTQFELLKKRIGAGVFTHHFPTYDSYQGKPVSEYLKGNYGSVYELSPYFINSLYAVDRAITWNLFLKREYDDKIILLDRYTTSSLIYQSALISDLDEKRSFIDYVSDFEYNKIGVKRPDLVIFLWAPFEMVTDLRNKRKLERGEAISGDVYENDLALMKKIYDGASFVADYCNFVKIDCTSDGKFRSISDIHEEIYDVVRKIL